MPRAASARVRRVAPAAAPAVTLGDVLAELAALREDRSVDGVPLGIVNAASALAGVELARQTEAQERIATALERIADALATTRP